MLSMASALLLGCGGSTNHNANEGAAGARNTASGGSSSDGGLSGSASAGTATTDTGGAPPDWALDSFETPDAMASIGLWMGLPGSEKNLPIGTPTVPHEGSALHLAGVTDDAGLDVFFHTGQPFERIFGGVRFWTQSDQPGSKLTIAVAGPQASYFTDRAQNLHWPARVVALSAKWQEVVIDFDDWGVDSEHLSPHSETFGAFHFIIEPNTTYDLWIDDFVGLPLYR